MKTSKADNPACRVKRVRTRNGRCYELAWKGCMQAPEWELVHGEAAGKPHAWLEHDGKVFCPSFDRIFTVQEYTDLLDAKALRRFTKHEAAKMVVADGTFGPWDVE